MSASDHIHTTVLVLKKVPYIGNKLLVYGLSPEYGKMTFFIRGSEKAKAMHGQPFDLFRMLEVTCRHSNRELYYPESVEILADFSSVATDYPAYDAACWLTGFAAQNTMPNLHAERYFLAIVTALRRLAAKEISPDSAIVCCNMVFLYEAGSLELEQCGEQERKQQEMLLDMAVGGEIIKLTDGVWKQLLEWTEHLLIQGDFLGEKQQTND